MEVKMEMKVEDAYRKSMETVLNWIQDTVNLNKSQVFFRTYAPVHFRFVICCNNCYDLYFAFQVLHIFIQ
ncbi:Protein trichome birefringence-like [Arachis hypogaea]|nr:Protein trichome birefringence-like [Arachis hypogaea]